MESKAMASPKVHETAIGLLADLPKEKILDLGAGRGALSKKLVELGFKVDYCDLEKRVDIKGADFHKVDLNKPFPFKDNTFFAITCIEVIEHIENPYQLMREAYRVLKPGGHMIVSTPNLENWYARLSFLIKGKLPHFYKENPFAHSGHITPIFSWKLNWAIKDRFSIEQVKFNRSFVPVLKIPLPFKNKLFGEILIVRLKSKK